MKSRKPRREGTVTLVLDPEVKDGIQKLAEEDDRSFSNYVTRLLREHIAAKAAELSQNRQEVA